MSNALIAGRDKRVFSEIKTILADNGMTTQWCDSGTIALSMLLEKSNDLIVIDENLPDMTGRQFIESVVMKNPMVNCVVASALSHKEFHEKYEGLGVLMQLPVAPGKKEAQELIEHLKHIFHLQKI